MPEARDSWWLSAQGRLYGPYGEDQLADYLDQGRLAGSSLLGRDPDGPFAPAATWPPLAPLFSPPEPFADIAAPAPSAERTLLVLAALRETRPETLEQALLTHGPCVRIKGTLWLAKARLPAPGLRNALSRRLGASEFLFVVEADLADAAWFNLDGDADRALRRLWSAG